MNNPLKYLSLFLVLVSTVLYANAAHTIPVNDSVPASYYRLKAKRQLTLAIVTASAGYATLAVGIVGMFARSFESILTRQERNSNGFKAMMVIGTVVGLSSIPIFISAKKNRRKYKTMMSAGVRMENTAIPKATTINKAAYPAFGIGISF